MRWTWRHYWPSSDAPMLQAALHCHEGQCIGLAVLKRQAIRLPRTFEPCLCVLIWVHQSRAALYVAGIFGIPDSLPVGHDVCKPGPVSMGCPKQHHCIHRPALALGLLALRAHIPERSLARLGRSVPRWAARVVASCSHHYDRVVLAIPERLLGSHPEAQHCRSQHRRVRPKPCKQYLHACSIWPEAPRTC